MGERSAGNPHAAFDVAEAGNVARHRPKLARQSSTLPVRGRPVMGVPTAIANRQRLQGFLRHGSDRPSARRCHPTPVVRSYDFYTRASSSARPIRSLVKPQEARRQSHRQKPPSLKSSSQRTPRWSEMDSNFQYAGAVNLFVASITMSPSNKGRSVGSVANRRSYLTRSNRPSRRRQPALRRS